MLTTEQSTQLSELLEVLGETLEISETQYDAAVKSYQAVGNWLSKDDSLIAPYKPEIYPQGSFLIGTAIKTINDQDDLDIDLICLVKGKHPDWTPYVFKQKVGDQLKLNETYKAMLDEEGRRCWTLSYRKDSESVKERYHMDILPAVASANYKSLLERSFLDGEIKDIDNLAIRITCREEENYRSERNSDLWLKSNPFGYAKWFLIKAALEARQLRALRESIAAVPAYQKDKLPLQRVVQILKRHRDMMFNGHELKPISVIITTLAGQSYNKESDIITALMNVIDRMPSFIEERFSLKHGKKIKWITNPVNEDENFADRWVIEPKREENFYKWLRQVKYDMQNVLEKRGLPLIQEALAGPFGSDLVGRTFSKYGDNLLKQRESGALKMAAKTGMLGAVGRTTVPQHKPYGSNE